MNPKDIRVAPIKASDANAFVKANHYSGKVVTNSQLHLGAFVAGRLLGVMSFGPPMVRRNMLGIVRDTSWSGMLELNRMAFSDTLPKNSESRALGAALRIIKKSYPHIEWILTFADGTSCGDGTIYRAVGAMLTKITRNKTMLRFPNGEILTDIAIRTTPQIRARAAKACGISPPSSASMLPFLRSGATVVPGFMLRYIIPLNDTVRGRLTVPELPYSAIAEAGASMYLGKSRAGALGSSSGSTGEGAFDATSALQAGQEDETGDSL